MSTLSLLGNYGHYRRLPPEYHSCLTDFKVGVAGFSPSEPRKSVSARGLMSRWISPPAGEGARYYIASVKCWFTLVVGKFVVSLETIGVG